MGTTTDTIIEEMVKVSAGSRPYLMKAAIVFAAIILDAAALFLLPHGFPVITALLVAGAFLGFKYTLTEFEYSFIRSGMDADLDIDRIQGQRKRTRVVSLKCKKIRSLVECDSNFTANANVRDCSIGKFSANRWLVTASTTDGSDITVLFNPSERLLNAIRQIMPQHLK
jgi:hypothetical protein